MYVVGIYASEITMQEESEAIVITYRVGIPTYEGGQTTLLIFNDGQVTVNNEYVGQESRCFKGMISVHELQLLNELIEHSKLWSQERRKTAIPGEASVEVILTRDNQAVHRVLLWENQFQDSEALQQLKRLFEQYIQSTSNGEVY